ncbi:MAG: TonB-dependent hemoglobin/transferrin/lactoferrin family receptor [Steroidobacteraceae bacterium]
MRPTSRRIEPRPAAALTLACVLAGGTASGAGRAPPVQDAVTGLETITVYARRLTPITEVAATVTVIDAARIEATLVGDVADLVRYEPGLAVRNDPFRFGLDTFAIRGLGGNRVAVEIDDIPAAGGFAVGSYADSGRAFVDPFFLRRVEFLRGPASSLYGSDAIGGVVAMSTLAPADLRSRDAPGTLALRAQAGYSSDDEGWQAGLLGAGRGGPGDWLLGYVRREGRELDTAAQVTPDPRDYTSDAVMAKYALPAVPGGELVLAFEAGVVEQQTSVDAFRGVGRFVNTTALEGDDRMQRQRASVQQSLGAAGRWFDSAQWRAYWQATVTDQDTYELRKAAPPRTPAVQLDRRFDFDESTIGFEFSAVRSFDGARRVHDVVYGVDASRSRLEERRDGLQTTIATGATTSVILGESFPLRDLPLTDVTEIGAYVQDHISQPGSRWTLIPALRADYYALDPSTDRIYREDNPSSRPVRVDEVSFAPKLGLTFAVADGLLAFFQYAHGFRSPPPEDVNIGLEIPLFRVRAVPNPDLQPEDSDGFELGLRFTGSAWTGTVSAFRTDYDNFIESKVNIGVDPATGVTLFQSRNVAEARIDGIEASLRWDGAAFDPRFDGWSARFAASWTRGRDLVRDQPLNSIEPPRAVLGARYEAPAAKWAGELALTLVEAQRQVDRSLANLYRTDGYATLDLFAEWRFDARLRLTVGLFNLTDQDYVQWADVRGRTADDPLLPYYTRPGFNAAATMYLYVR